MVLSTAVLRLTLTNVLQGGIGALGPATDVGMRIIQLTKNEDVKHNIWDRGRILDAN